MHMAIYVRHICQVQVDGYHMAMHMAKETQHKKAFWVDQPDGTQVQVNGLQMAAMTRIDTMQRSAVARQETESIAKAELVASHSKIQQHIASIMDASAKKAKSLYCEEGCPFVEIVNAIKADDSIDHTICNPKITCELIAQWKTQGNWTKGQQGHRKRSRIK